MQAAGQRPGRGEPAQQAWPGHGEPAQQAWPSQAQPGQAQPGQAQPGQAQPYGYPPQPSAAPYAAAGHGGGYPPDRDPRLAEPWRRLVGWIIDGVILGIVTAALWIPLGVSFADRLRNVANAYPNSTAPGAQTAYNHAISQTAGSFLIVLAATFCISIGYYWLLTGSWGTTIGKRIVGTWVVSANGWTKVGLGAALVRALVFVLGGEIIPFFFLVDNLWLLWDPQRQCLHDKAASTIVVKSIAVGR